MFTHALQIRSSQHGELCMIGPTWSPCSRFAPFYETGRPSYLYMLNAQLETVMTFQSDQCTHSHKYECCHGEFLCAWAPDSILVASASSGAPRHVAHCWHPSGQQSSTKRKAAQIDKLLAACADEALCCLAWSPRKGLAALTVVHKGNTGVSAPCPRKLYMAMPHQSLTNTMMT